MTVCPCAGEEPVPTLSSRYWRPLGVVTSPLAATGGCVGGDAGSMGCDVGSCDPAEPLESLGGAFAGSDFFG